ncbi:indolin-2-one monooxygenase-like [Miscanthus floridulus]|uniref:indolin-2-one monooxygenase-like n=1 Tax=Miscanthus floridulus TaxID=154761 RepID=UPI00345B4382
MIRTVKILALDSPRDLDVVIDLLKCFPCVEKLYMELHHYGDSVNVKGKLKNARRNNVPLECLDTHLKVLELRNYRGRRSEELDQDFFRCEEGYEAKVDAVADKAAKKLVKDMHYEACIQAVIQYHAKFLRERIPKRVARTMSITSEQYLKSVAHGGEPCSQFVAYALAHKGKVTSDVAYNPEDPPSAYSNESVHSRLDGYTSMARVVHGLDDAGRHGDGRGGVTGAGAVSARAVPPRRRGEDVDLTGSREIKMMPFGARRRMCPGVDVSLLHLEWFVANMVREFEWKEVPGQLVDFAEKLVLTMVMA